MKETLYWVYKNDFTGHWMVDRHGPKPMPQYVYDGEGCPPRRLYRTVSMPGVMGFRTAEAAWEYVGGEVDKRIVERKLLDEQRAALIARERELHPWLYEDGGYE